MAAWRYLLFFFVFFLLPLAGRRNACAWAQADASAARAAVLPPDTVVALPEVTIEAARPRADATAPSRRVTVLDAADIEASGARSVAELLEARTGVFIKRYGAGGLATLSLRGTSSQQTLVLLDGIRLADPQTGQVDLSLLPTVLLRSVEVVHGAAGARYGSGALGGVVRLHTLRPTQDVRLNASATAGAWGARRAGMAVRAGTKHLKGVFAAEASRAEGDFPYENGALLGTPEVRRTGADRHAATLFGKLRYEGTHRHLTLTGWYTHAARGLPGTAGTNPAEARQWDTHLRLAARYTAQPAWGTLTATAHLQRTRRRYAGPVSGDTSRTRRYAMGVQATSPISTRWLLRGGIKSAYARAALRGGVGRLHAGAFLNATGDFGRLSLRPALRLDTYFSEADARRIVALSPALGASLQPFAWKGLRLKARLARAFRAPTLNERFYRPGGNPDLKAESGISAETGVSVTVERSRWSAQAEATAFFSRIRNQIIWRPTFVAPGVRGWRPRNVGRVVTRGLEISANVQYRPRRAFQFSGGFVFTRTDAENRSAHATRAFGKQLPYVPPAQLKLRAGAAYDVPGAFGTVYLHLNGRFVGRRYFTADETQAVPPYRVFDAQLRYEHAFGPLQVSLSLSIENLTDRTYEVMRGYPMPPRHARLQLTLQTSP